VDAAAVCGVEMANDAPRVRKVLRSPRRGFFCHELRRPRDCCAAASTNASPIRKSAVRPTSAHAGTTAGGRPRSYVSNDTRAAPDDSPQPRGDGTHSSSSDIARVRRHEYPANSIKIYEKPTIPPNFSNRRFVIEKPW
jgi:hypothetical protein